MINVVEKYVSAVVNNALRNSVVKHLAEIAIGYVGTAQEVQDEPKKDMTRWTREEANHSIRIDRRMRKPI